MKKRILSLALASAMALSMVACGGNQESAAPAANDGAATTDTAAAPEATGELVDGKFAETRHITVEVYDRANDGGSDVTNNKYTDYIKQGMLDKYNVEVEFVAVPRWTEVEQINNLLAAGDAPDICVTYDYATIQTYANMGGVLNLADYVDGYKSELPELWNWLTDYNIYYDKDPNNGNLWALEAKLAVSNRIVTFIRQDWLDTLGLKAPTTTQEFEDTMIAFRDNADKLLGADASKMVPYSASYDIGWRTATLIESFIDEGITDKEYYINGYDDRKLTENGTKEAVRLLNKWYNDGLMWKDFTLYGSGDSTEDDMMKAGYVGAFTHNWDYPFRNGEDSINHVLSSTVGENAKFVAIDPFKNAKGNYTKFVSGPIDRKIFFPSTNDEPLASMLYLNFISSPEVIEYLQIGDEGVTHNVLDSGAIEIVAATGDAIQNSGFNIDYTITCNGLKLQDENKTNLSRAYSYAFNDPELVQKAHEIANTDLKVIAHASVGEITAESGMGDVLSSQRDVVYDQAVVCKTAEFDSVWDSNLQTYLGMGGQAIMDERASAWEATYGSSESVQ